MFPFQTQKPYKERLYLYIATFYQLANGSSLWTQVVFLQGPQRLNPHRQGQQQQPLFS